MELETRDLFAAAALIGLLMRHEDKLNGDCGRKRSPEWSTRDRSMCDHAFEIADEMVIARGYSTHGL